MEKGNDFVRKKSWIKDQGTLFRYEVKDKSHENDICHDRK